MTDTRKEFEEFFNTHRTTPATTYEMIERSWHACQSLNDKRIEQLLAVIAKKDDALSAVDDLIEHQYCGSKDAMTDLQIACDMTHESLALQPADVELVEVGDFNVNDQSEWGFDPYGNTREHYDRTVKNVGVGTHKLYTIKTKANTK